MRKVVVLAVLVTFLAVGGWLVRGGETPRPSRDVRASESRAQGVELERERTAAAREPAAASAPGASTPPSRVRSKAEREAMRRRILEAMQTRERGPEADTPRGAGATPPRRGSDAPGREGEPKKRPDDGAPAPGNLIDRTGNHGHMVKVMNEDLMPLVDECYALARETQPELTGLLVLDVEMIGDEDIGGVVESAGLGKDSELVDPSLVECVQESLLSVTLPPPPEGGKDSIQLQMRLEPEAG